MSAGLLDFAEDHFVYDEDRRHVYLDEFTSAKWHLLNESFGKSKTSRYSSKELVEFYQRVLAEAYDNPRVNFEDAVVGYLIHMCGYNNIS